MEEVRSQELGVRSGPTEVMKYLPVTVRFDGCWCSEECEHWCNGCYIDLLKDTPLLGHPETDLMDGPSVMIPQEQGEGYIRTRECCRIFGTPDVDEHLPCHICGKPMTNKECIDCRPDYAVAISTEQEPDDVTETKIHVCSRCGQYVPPQDRVPDVGWQWCKKCKEEFYRRNPKPDNLTSQGQTMEADHGI